MEIIIKALVAHLPGAVFLFVMALPAHATLITIGALSSHDDGSTEVIVDSLNNLEWLRFDVLPHLNYAQTLAATSAGAYSDWSIAGVDQATAFYNALAFPSATGCTAGNHGWDCDSVTGNVAGLLGDDWLMGDDIYAWYLGNISKVGLFGYDPHTGGGLYRQDDWGSISSSDNWSQTGDYYNVPISWLLYRDSRRVVQQAAVPEPAAFVLLSFGFAGLGYARRRQLNQESRL